MDKCFEYKNNDLNLKATELRLGQPGSSDEFENQSNSTPNRKKRALSDVSDVSEESRSNISVDSCESNANSGTAPPPKVQVVGWPPIRSYRKNCFQGRQDESEGGGMYVKVSVDGAPYLRKIDLKVYKSYSELLEAFENKFMLTIGEYSETEGYNGSEYAPTYEDKDGDLMLVGDVPWEMFISNCKRLRIMKGSEARGLACL